MVLEALERDDIKRLPGGIFTRAFLRSYAVEVGLDPDTTVDEFLAQFPPESVIAGTVGEPVEDHQAIESDRRAAQTFVRLMAVSLPIAAVVIYFSVRPSLSRDEAATRPSMTAPVSVVEKGSKTPPPPTIPPPAIPPPVKPTEVVAVPPPKPSTPVVTRPSVTEAASSATVGSQPATPVTASSADATVPAEVKVPPPVQKRPDTAKAAAPPDSVMMVIDQPSRCWVAVAVDGEAVARERLGSGERLELKAAREIVVTVGEDTPCSYTLNGSAGRPLGQPGAIVTRRISPDNYRTYLSR